MCDFAEREKAMVVIERDDAGVPIVWCDPCLVGIVAALNAGGLRTVASCCGHGQRDGVISLQDGRELYLVNSRARSVLGVTEKEEESR